MKRSSVEVSLGLVRVAVALTDKIDGPVANVTVILEDIFCCSEIKLHRYPDGSYRLIYPMHKSQRRSTPVPIFHFLDEELADAIEDEAIALFESLVDSQEAH